MLAAMLAALAIAAPAGAATRIERQAAAFAVPMPAAPLARDLVIEYPSSAAARAAARANLRRVPVNDGAGRSVEITQSLLCTASCDDSPEEIANLLGTFPHGEEMNLLNVFMVKPEEMAGPTACFSANALACYYPSLNRMVISGDDFTIPSDNATQEFVIAHEYGHHLANHRTNPPFDTPAIDWGPKRWATYVRVCEGVEAGRYFPGRAGAYYYANPGEAFAESYGFTVFPSLGVVWNWTPFPKPDAAMYPRIQADALDPWVGPKSEKRQGRFPKRKRPKRKVKKLGTALDGDMTLKLNGPARPDYALILRGPDGKELERSDGVGSKEAVSYRICGEGSFSATVRRHGRKRTRFFLNGQLP